MTSLLTVVIVLLLIVLTYMYVQSKKQKEVVRTLRTLLKYDEGTHTVKLDYGTYDVKIIAKVSIQDKTDDEWIIIKDRVKRLPFNKSLVGFVYDLEVAINNQTKFNNIGK